MLSTELLSDRPDGKEHGNTSVRQAGGRDRGVNVTVKLVEVMCWLLLQSPGGNSAAAMPPPPYYITTSRADVVLPYPDDLDDDDTDWDRLL